MIITQKINKLIKNSFCVIFFLTTNKKLAKIQIVANKKLALKGGIKKCLSPQNKPKQFAESKQTSN